MPLAADHSSNARSTSALSAAVALVALLWSGGCAAAAPAVLAPPAPAAPAPATSAPAAPGTSAPAQPPVEPGAVRITGAVRQPGVRTAAQLAAIPSQTVAVTFGTEKGSQRHTEVGVPLSTVMEQAAPVLTAGRKHDELTIGVLATSQDGTPLARPRLVLPKDGQGTRYVSDVVELHVVHLGPGS